MNRELKQLIDKTFHDEKLIRLTMSRPRKKSQTCRKISMRPVMLHGGLAYQCEYHFEKKVTHENMTPAEAADSIEGHLRLEFKQMNIMTTDEDIQVLANKIDKPRITCSSACHEMPQLSHNRKKQYIIPDGEPCDFLIRLGVMDASGSVIQKHYSKFRQINRYLEIVDDVFPCLPEGRVKIIDFGCGKAYLTFALYHYLRRIKGLQADIIGLDLKEDVIEFCSQVADDLGYEGLRFSVGDIAEYEDTSADMVVTLHACDTATDYALINAVSWNTRVILSVPCCQHELFSQIDNPVLDPMLRHGIIRDRFTEILTDGVRGLKLESKGYDVSMIEFTSLEHTARNIMIKAIKTRDPEDARSQKAAAQYAAICREYKIHPTIGEMK